MRHAPYGEEVTVTKHARAAMRDGCELAAEIYRPTHSGRPLPVYTGPRVGCARDVPLYRYRRVHFQLLGEEWLKQQARRFDTA